MGTKDDRLFAPFPIEMDEHPKIIGLSDRAFRAIIEATFYSRRMLTDGFLDERVVLRRWGQDAADELASNDPNRPSWVRVEGGWQIHDFEKHHPLRAEIERKRAETSAKRSQAGSKGATSRWQNDGKPVATDSSETESETETSTTAPAVRKREIDASFNTFWAAWPLKKGKKEARVAFEKAIKSGITLDRILSGVENYKREIGPSPDWSKVKWPQGWLNGERWEDEAPPTPIDIRERVSTPPPPGTRWAADVINDPEWQANWGKS